MIFYQDFSFLNRTIWIQSWGCKKQFGGRGINLWGSLRKGLKRVSLKMAHKIWAMWGFDGHVRKGCTEASGSEGDGITRKISKSEFQTGVSSVLIIFLSKQCLLPLSNSLHPSFFFIVFQIKIMLMNLLILVRLNYQTFTVELLPTLIHFVTLSRLRGFWFFFLFR